MRIVYVAPSYYPHIGGVEYVVKPVAERLARLGHEVIVLTGEPGIDKPVEEFISRVRVVRWPVWSPGGAYHMSRRREELKKTLKELSREADVIYIHSVYAIFTVSLGIMIDNNTHSARPVITLHYHSSGHAVLKRLL